MEPLSLDEVGRACWYLAAGTECGVQEASVTLGDVGVSGGSQAEVRDIFLSLASSPDRWRPFFSQVTLGHHPHTVGSFVLFLWHSCPCAPVAQA